MYKHIHIYITIYMSYTYIYNTTYIHHSRTMTIMRTLKKLLGFSAVSCEDFRKNSICGPLHCSVLQRIAVCCSLFQKLLKIPSLDSLIDMIWIIPMWITHWFGISSLAVYCSLWQFVAVCCSVLQCVAVCCTDIWKVLPVVGFIRSIWWVQILFLCPFSWTLYTYTYTHA